MAQTRSTAYRLVSYARAHDYGESNAGRGPARYSDKWMNQNLRLHLDEISNPGASSAPFRPLLRLRIATNVDSDTYPSSSQVVMRGETYEDLDLTLYQRLLKESPPPAEQNGYPIRVVYRGTQVVFRYQVPAAIPIPRVPIAYRRFQLMFAEESDVRKVIEAIKTYCHCSDQSDAAKARSNTKKGKLPRSQTIVSTAHDTPVSEQPMGPSNFPTSERRAAFTSSQPPMNYDTESLYLSHNTTQHYQNASFVHTTHAPPSNSQFLPASSNSSSSVTNVNPPSSSVGRPQSAMEPPRPIPFVPPRPTTTAFGSPSTRWQTENAPYSDRANFHPQTIQLPTLHSQQPSHIPLRAQSVSFSASSGPLAPPIQMPDQTIPERRLGSGTSTNSGGGASQQVQPGYIATKRSSNVVFDCHTGLKEVDLNAIIASLRATAGTGGQSSLLLALMNRPQDLQKVMLEMLNDPAFVQLLDGISALLMMHRADPLPPV